ncbi:MAG: UDP-N-acetylmuramoyl-L-alanine--D-glutamate ligase [Propionibacteriaceae bacterium]|jgi:UDP-N-acetylmuramoylalanine--D-glutamate ligase|nr:UDP-N-acetylmuramoyl-L-alanine--D-glutamate ligase [Propionibacteriaceae bacterium]
MGGGPVTTWIDWANRLSDWSRARVTVAGIGTSGYAAADVLLEYGAAVTVLDDSDAPAAADKAKVLELLGAEVRLGPGSSTRLPGSCDLVVTSPGWRPASPLFAEARARAIPVWGDVELAWRFQQPDRVVPWLAVTGTNGKTTTVTMVEAMLKAAGLTVAAVGNVGRPILETVLDGVAYDCLAVELSSFELHWTKTLGLHSAAVLNVEPDHLEWHADNADPFAAYAADKARIFNQVTHACVYNVADPRTEAMVEAADVVEGARAIGFTLGIPGPSMLGVVDGLLVDRAFIPQRRDSALELAKVGDLPTAAPHMVADALAAAALVRSFGVPAAAVRDGLRAYTLGPHRIQTVLTAGGVTWVDDSKATNAHAAHASLAGFDKVVWIAGGQAKGTRFEDLVRAYAGRFRAAVLLGTDRGVVAEAFAAEAPGVPVVILDDLTKDVMTAAVGAAARFAQPGDTVLLAPACASQDLYADYAERGDYFAAAAKKEAL